MAEPTYEVMTSKKAKALLAKKGILMPWQDGFAEQVKGRFPDESEKIAEVTNREEKALEDAQVKKVKKALKASEGGDE
jgi:hypothetical protein